MLSSISSWQPRTPEDLLIYRYWQEHEGRLFLEVPIGGPSGSGNWEEGCTTRRLGEATAVFLDDVPTFRYSVEAREWLKRARQASVGAVGGAPR